LVLLSCQLREPFVALAEAAKHPWKGYFFGIPIKQRFIFRTGEKAMTSLKAALSALLMLISPALLAQTPGPLLPMPLVSGDKPANVVATAPGENNFAEKSALSGQQPLLNFPLPNLTPYNAAITSVFDHSMNAPYHPDNVVVAYTGEEGRIEFGKSTAVDFGFGALYGFKNAGDTEFVVNGNFKGAGSGLKYLEYDGHPGFDFNTKYDANQNGILEADEAAGVVEVLAAASGKVVKADMQDYGTLKIDHGNGYVTAYLHLSKFLVAVGETVPPGKIIGKSGGTGKDGKLNAFPNHLHFEVRFNDKPVDPYGWAGQQKDPYLNFHPEARNTNLWLGAAPSWARTYNGSANAIDAAYVVAADRDGNIYVAGQSQGKNSGYDIVTIKYNSAGTQQWIASYDGPGHGNDGATDIAIDPFGNVVVTGFSYGGFSSDSDYVTIKYNPAGVRQWVARHNGTANARDFATALAIDGSGNIYVTGYSYNYNSYNNWSHHYGTIKYNPSGAQQWIRTYHFNRDGATSIAVDKMGNVYVTGVSGSGAGTWDYATVKYNSSGVEQWVVRYNGEGNDEDWGAALALDSQANVYVTGYSKGNGSGFDAATIKYSSSGIAQWVARYNGPSNADDKTYKIRLDGAGNVYVAGVRINNNFDYLTIKYNSAGQQKWVAQYNGAGDGKDTPSGLSIDSQGNVYVTGWSMSAGSGFDCTSIKYNALGLMQWYATYNGTGNSNDYANAMTLDSQGSLYIAGRANNSGSGDDFVLLKYGKNSFPTSVRTMEFSSARNYVLRQNYPNPFNANTTIEYGLSKEGFVTLKIYDMLGREVVALVKERQKPGTHQVTWNANTSPTGVYLYQLQAGEFVDTKKLVLLR
jgi:uncharacterized delta-60 repeat protein